MANKFLTLLDLTKLAGTSDAVGLIEEVTTSAPEVAEIKGSVITGVNYSVRVRTALPAGPIFRDSNEGTELIASTYSRKEGQCYYMDANMQVDEKDVMRSLGEGKSVPDVLSLEASAVMRQHGITIGSQFYTGTSNDAKGFAGLLSLYDATNCLVEATGSTSGSLTSAWLVYNAPDGLEFIFGNPGGESVGFQVNPWQRIRTTDANSKFYWVYATNGTGWIGLRLNHTKAVVRISEIETAKFSDALVAEAISKLPVWMRRSPNLRLLMNPRAHLILQKSRSTVNVDNSAKSGLTMWAPPPTESNGVQIIITDSIGNAEATT